MVPGLSAVSRCIISTCMFASDVGVLPINPQTRPGQTLQLSIGYVKFAGDIV